MEISPEQLSAASTEAEISFSTDSSGLASEGHYLRALPMGCSWPEAVSCSLLQLLSVEGCAGLSLEALLLPALAVELCYEFFIVVLYLVISKTAAFVEGVAVQQAG